MSTAALVVAARNEPRHVPTSAVLRRCSCGGQSRGSGECAECSKKRLQRKATSAGPSSAPASVHAVLADSGQPLAADVRARMEPRLGHDLRNVRVHTDARAARAAADVGALAWAVSNRIAFASGQYRPGTTAGDRLLVHELAHTVQQTGSSLTGDIRVGAVDDAVERDADRVAEGAQGPLSPRRVRAPVLRRQVDAAPAAKLAPSAGCAVPAQRPRAAAGKTMVSDARVHGQADDSGATQPALVRSVVARGGRPLADGIRRDMEQAFGHDLAHVRIHDDSLAAQSARAEGALAYAMGQHIVFGAGQLTRSVRGTWLLAHELAHVAQLRGSGPGGTQALESEARAAAMRVVRGQHVRMAQTHDGRRLHRFGEPENLPQITFVAGTDPVRDGFLKSALDYHRAWGLAPHTIDSLEDVITHLSGGTSGLNRIRIVSHADSPGLFMNLFEGSGALTLTKEQLVAVAESDVSILTQAVGTITTTPVDTIVNQLRTHQPDALRPFGLAASGTASGSTALLIQRSLDLRVLQMSGAGAEPIRVAIRTILDDLRRRVTQPAPHGAGVSAPQAQALQDAILGLNMTLRSALLPANWLREVGAVNTAVAGGFRDRLKRTRARFTASSWIDIRGCSVGGDTGYLSAVAALFGNAPNLPHVSAPDWFQAFPTLAHRAVEAARIDALARDSDVARALDHWAQVTGIRSQMLAWQLFYLNVLIELQRARRPGTTQLQSPSLSAPSLPPLTGGLRTRMPPLELNVPALSLRGMARRSRRARPAEHPVEQTVRAELAELAKPSAELRYYLNAGLVLPVQNERDRDAYRLHYLYDLRDVALDNWLGSQWDGAAPGLASVKSGGWPAENTRRVATLSKLLGPGTERGQETVISPDPRYREHIKSV
ncbi:MAG: DUF4157 domain-containing protein [Longimicrobiales bacterium]